MKSAVRKLPPNGEGPLYKQLADLIHEEIKQGIIEPNSNLPTVRDLADEMSLSPGTVMHAYDELEAMGIVDKVRGSGTFVRCQSEIQTGKKDRAMQIMDNMFFDMQQLGFSLRQTQIYFDLKMRGLEDIPKLARVMAVDCNPEALSVITNQISELRGVQVRSSLLDDLAFVTELLEERPDIIVTTANHFDMVANTARKDLVTKVVLSPSRNTIAKLAKTEHEKVGIFTASDRFAEIIGNVCSDFSGLPEKIPHLLFGDDKKESFLKSLDTAILPNYYSQFCSQSDISAIRAFQEAGGNIIEFTYHIDAGSLMYLEQKIETVLANKQ